MTGAYRQTLGIDQTCTICGQLFMPARRRPDGLAEWDTGFGPRICYPSTGPTCSRDCLDEYAEEWERDHPRPTGQNLSCFV
ncbi:MAG: hypothetical protein ABIP48_18065 [Planctomycetota bacterium]